MSSESLTIMGTPRRPASGDLPEIPGFEVLELAGRGGMGSVFKAKQIGLDRIVAVKMLPASCDPRMIERFIAEARSAGSLNHPHIAAIYDVGGDFSHPFYVMEYAEHGTLSGRLAGQPQPPRETASLLALLAEAVQHCHDHGLIHRDLKPANVLLAVTEGRTVPKISDFGLVKRTQDQSKLTYTGEILGTPSYMAPEQASGVFSNIGPGADIYALGAILYECLTGRPPFIGAEPMQVVMQLLAEDPLPPRILERTIPRDLETIALKCLEKSPRKRYHRAEDLAIDLRRWLAGEPILARPASRLERTWKWIRRRPWQTAALAASAIVIVGSITSAILLDRKAYELARANETLLHSKAETDRMLEVALASLDKYYFGLSENLQDLPGAEKIRRDVINQARGTLEKIEEIRPNDPALREYQAYSWLKLGTIDLQEERMAPAREAFDRAHVLFASLSASQPDQLQFRVKKTLASFRSAQARQHLGEASAQEHFDSAIAAAEKLYEEASGDADVLLVAAAGASERFKAAIAKNSPKADVHLMRVVELRRRRAALLMNDPAALAESISAELIWSNMLSRQGKLAEAEATLQAACDRARDRAGKSIAFSRLQLLALQELARLAEKRTDFPAAASTYNEVVGLQRRALANRPKAAGPRRDLIDTLLELGRVSRLAELPESAKGAFEEARKLAGELPEPDLELDASIRKAMGPDPQK